MMRYLPLTQPDRDAMLAVIGAGSIDDLFVDVPEAARLSGSRHFVLASTAWVYEAAAETAVDETTALLPSGRWVMGGRSVRNACVTLAI